MHPLRHPVEWFKAHPTVADGLLAAVVLTAVLLILYSGGDIPQDVEWRDPDPAAIALLVVASVSLTWRRRSPVWVFAISASCIVVYEVTGYVSTSGLPGLVALYTVAAHCTRRVSLGALAVTGAVLPVIFLSAPWDPDFATWISNYVVFGTAWVVGDSLRTRRAYVAELTERAERAEREREQEARQAVADERARIARELHDVVAHAMSVMIVQTGGARRILDHDPARAAEALEQVESTGRAAMAEMRTLLGVLRDDERGSTPDRAPQPGLDRLGELVADCEAAGVPVTLRIEGDPGALPSGLDLTAYRIVQEALTNVRRHAGEASAVVEVTVTDPAVEVRVTDDGLGAAATSDGLGHGLVGMRERVEMYGGRLRAGPQPGGGFEVRAHLPIPDGPAATRPDVVPARGAEG